MPTLPEEALLAAPPLLEALCKSSPFTQSNTFVPGDKTKYLSVKWLFGQPQLSLYVPYRHQIMAAVAVRPGFETFADDKGVIIAVRWASKVALDNVISTGDDLSDPEISDPRICEPLLKMTSELLRHMRPTASNSTKLAEPKVVVFLVSAVFRALSRPANCRWKNVTLEEYTGVLSRSSLFVVLKGGAFVQTKQYLSQARANEEVLLRTSSIPKKSSAPVQPSTHTTSPDAQSKSLTNATVNLLAHICPTDSNCELVAWRGGQRKLMFKVSVICQALPEGSRRSQTSYLKFLKSTPKFTVINDKYVHIAEYLTRMPTEEQLTYEIAEILNKSEGGAVPSNELFKMLSVDSRLRIVSPRSLLQFISSNGDVFKLGNGGVQLSQAGASITRPSAVADSAVAKVPAKPVVASSIFSFENMVVQRCTFLVLNGKWKTSTQTTCNIDWLCHKLAGIPTQVKMKPDQLLQILKANHMIFIVSEDGADVRVVNDSIPEGDAAVISKDLVSILERNGSVTLQRTIELFGMKRKDNIYLSKSLTKKFVQDRSDLFRLDGEEVSLIGVHRATAQSNVVLIMRDTLNTPVASETHGDIDLDFLCPLDHDEDDIYANDEEDIYDGETTDAKIDPSPKRSGIVEKFKKLFRF